MNKGGRFMAADDMTSDSDCSSNHESNDDDDTGIETEFDDFFQSEHRDDKELSGVEGPQSNSIEPRLDDDSDDDPWPPADPGEDEDDLTSDLDCFSDHRYSGDDLDDELLLPADPAEDEGIPPSVDSPTVNY
jgi:hypothetical protein